MSRKRTPDQKSTENSTATAESPPAETTTVIETPPAAETTEASQSFADKVEPRKRVSAPDPFTIAADTVAGVRLFESERDRQMAIQFGEGRREDKPSQAVIDTMKDAGYRWNPSDKIWAHPVTPQSAMTTRIKAERLYQQVTKMIRQEKGIEVNQEVPF